MALIAHKMESEMQIACLILQSCDDGSRHVKQFFHPNVTVARVT